MRTNLMNFRELFDGLPVQNIFLLEKIKDGVIDTVKVPFGIGTVYGIAGYALI